jgi:hypothetical protein
MRVPMSILYKRWGQLAAAHLQADIIPSSIFSFLLSEPLTFMTGAMWSTFCLWGREECGSYSHKQGR